MACRLGDVQVRTDKADAHKTDNKYTNDTPGNAKHNQKTKL